MTYELLFKMDSNSRREDDTRIRVTVQDTAWATTLPHRLFPRTQEWLPGFLLHCDAVNGWSSGTVLNDIYSAVGLPGGIAFFNGITPNTFPYQLFADLLAAPVATIRATTYSEPLSRLFATERPYTSQLGAFRRRYNPICPVCVQDHLLAKNLAHPGLTLCPNHHIRLQAACICGEPIHYIHRGAQPFTCLHCSTAWFNLPHVHGSAEACAYEQTFLHLYTHLLSNGNAMMLKAIPTAVRQWLTSKNIIELHLSDGTSLSTTHLYGITQVSVARIVMMLMEIEIRDPGFYLRFFSSLIS